jgi:hypothetical protein
VPGNAQEDSLHAGLVTGLVEQEAELVGLEFAQDDSEDAVG